MYSRHHNHFGNSLDRPDRGCVADQPQPQRSKPARAPEGCCVQSVQDWSALQIRARLVGLAAAAIASFTLVTQGNAGQPTTNEPPPIYQVLDRKPTNLILNFFK